MQDYKPLIGRITDIPGVSVAHEAEDYIGINLETGYLKIPKRSIESYIKSFDKERKFIDRVKLFLTAQNEGGKVAKSVKDITLTFTPFGEQISDVTDIIARQIRRTMPQEKKEKSQSKTIIIFGLLFFAGLLQQFGVDLGLELSPDAEWVMIGSGIVGILLRLVTKKPVELGTVLKTLLRQYEN